MLRLTSISANPVSAVGTTLVAWVLFAKVASASTDMLSDAIPIRESGSDFQVTIKIAKGDQVLFANNEDCGKSHKTGKGRFYEHVHVKWDIPETGIKGTDQNGNARTITFAKIKAYWDNHYSGYGSSLTEATSYNCHGLTFANFTWPQDITFITEDDYALTDTWEDTVALTDGNNHSIWVYGKTPGNYWGYTVYTAEKNRESRYYFATWTWVDPPNATTKWKKAN